MESSTKRWLRTRTPKNCFSNLTDQKLSPFTDKRRTFAILMQGNADNKQFFAVLLYNMILFNFLFLSSIRLQFLFQLSLKSAHFEVEIIVAQAEIAAQG